LGHHVLASGVVAWAVHLNLTEALGEIDLEAAVAVGQGRVATSIDQNTRDRLAGEGVQHHSAYRVEDWFLLGNGEHRDARRAYCRHHQESPAPFRQKAQLENPLLHFAVALLKFSQKFDAP